VTVVIRLISSVLHWYSTVDSILYSDHHRIYHHVGFITPVGRPPRGPMRPGHAVGGDVGAVLRPGAVPGRGRDRGGTRLPGAARGLTISEKVTPTAHAMANVAPAHG
jgi:hypothetical protein